MAEKQKFAEVFEKVLKQRNWSQAFIAKETGISEALISMIISGKRDPTDKFLKRVNGLLKAPELEVSYKQTQHKTVSRHRPNFPAPVSEDTRRLLSLRLDLFAEIEKRIKKLDEGGCLVVRSPYGLGGSLAASAVAEAMNVSSKRLCAHDITLQIVSLRIKAISAIREPSESTQTPEFDWKAEMNAEEILRQINRPKKANLHNAPAKEVLSKVLETIPSPTLVLRDATRSEFPFQLVASLCKNVSGLRIVIVTKELDFDLNAPLTKRSAVQDVSLYHVTSLSREELLSVAEERVPDLDLKREDAERISGLGEDGVGIDEACLILSGLRETVDAQANSDLSLTTLMPNSIDKLSKKLSENASALANSESPSADQSINPAIVQWSLELIRDCDAANLDYYCHILVFATLFEGSFSRDIMAAVLKRLGKKSEIGELETALMRLTTLGWLFWLAPEEGRAYGIRYSFRASICQVLSNEQLSRSLDLPFVDMQAMKIAFVEGMVDTILPVRESSGGARVKLLKYLEPNLLAALTHARTFKESSTPPPDCSRWMFEIVQRLQLLYTANDTFHTLEHFLTRAQYFFEGQTRERQEIIQRYLGFAYLRVNQFSKAAECFGEVSARSNSEDTMAVEFAIAQGIFLHLTQASCDQVLKPIQEAIETLVRPRRKDSEVAVRDLAYEARPKYWLCRLRAATTCRLDEAESFQKFQTDLRLALAAAQKAQHITYLTLLNLWGARMAFLRVIAALDSNTDHKYYKDSMEHYLLAAGTFLNQAIDHRGQSHHQLLWSLWKMIDKQTATSNDSSLNDLNNAFAEIYSTSDSYWICFNELLYSLLLATKKNGAGDAAKHLIKAVQAWKTMEEQFTDALARDIFKKSGFQLSNYDSKVVPALLFCSMMKTSKKLINQSNSNDLLIDEDTSTSIDQWGRMRDESVSQAEKRP